MATTTIVQRDNTFVNDDTTAPSLWPSVLLVLAGLVIIVFVTLGKPFVEIPGIVNGAIHLQRSLDLTLFDGWDNPRYWYAPYTNTFGNIALFVPFGLGIAALLKRLWFTSVGAVVAGSAVLSFGLSLCVEVIQYVRAWGYSDVDDLLFNTIGGAVGAAIFMLVPRTGRGSFVSVAAGFFSIVAVLLFVVGVAFAR